MGSGGDGGTAGRKVRLAQAFGVGSVLLAAVYPFLATPAQVADLAVVYLGSAACVAIGRRAVMRDARLPWTLLLAAQLVLVVANIAQSSSSSPVVVAGWLLGSAGNLLAVAASITLIVRPHVRDVGGLVDAALIGFAVGSLLWAVLPHRGGFAEQLHLFVVVFALPSTLGPLARLMGSTRRQPAALWWLMAALALALAGHVITTVADNSRLLVNLGAMLFMLTFTAIGLFALSPSAARATEATAAMAPERLSAGRLALLGLAVAAVPAIGGVPDAANMGWLLLLVPGSLIATLVMVRIGLLATARERAEQALAHQAAHDPLTGLPNRAQLLGRLQEILAAGERCAMLFCDIDGFKEINDRYGHDVGDQLLVEVAQRLRRTVRAPDLVGRIGGDEFVVLLINATDARAATVRERVQTALAQPSPAIGGAGIDVSIGIATGDGIVDPDQLLRAADHAMYEVKRTRARRR